MFHVKSSKSSDGIEIYPLNYEWAYGWIYRFYFYSAKFRSESAYACYHKWLIQWQLQHRLEWLHKIPVYFCVNCRLILDRLSFFLPKWENHI